MLSASAPAARSGSSSGCAGRLMLDAHREAGARADRGTGTAARARSSRTGLAARCGRRARGSAPGAAGDDQHAARARKITGASAIAGAIVGPWTGISALAAFETYLAVERDYSPRRSRSTCATSRRCARTCARSAGKDVPPRAAVGARRAQPARRAVRQNGAATIGAQAVERARVLSVPRQARRDRRQPGRRDPRAEEAEGPAARARRRRCVSPGRGAEHDRPHRASHAVAAEERAPRSAAPARCRAARAALRDRAARLRGVRRSTSTDIDRDRYGDADRAGAPRQGRQVARGAARRRRRSRARGVPAGAARARGRPARRCSSTRRASG